MAQNDSAASVVPRRQLRPIPLASQRSVRVTHPFHPWFGREFLFLAVRQTWSHDRVFFLDEEGTQFSLPVGWTDAAEPDPFVAAAGWPVPVSVR